MNNHLPKLPNQPITLEIETIKLYLSKLRLRF